MNTSNSSSVSCSVTTFILTSQFLPPFLYIELFLAILAILLNFLFIFNIIKVKQFHPNLRYLFIYFSLCLIWYSLGRTYKTISTLHLTFVKFPCEYMKTAYNCGLHELPISISSFITPWAFFGLCLERLYATIRYKMYDNIKTPIWIIILYILIISTFPVLNNIILIIKLPRTNFSPICESLLINKSMRTGIIWINILSVLVCLVSTLICKFWNDHRMKTGALNRSKQTLASRFQIVQNVQINRMLLPTILVQISCMIPQFSLLILLLYTAAVPVTMRGVLIYCNYVWRLTYAAVHPILAFWCIRPLREEIKRWLDKYGKSNSTVSPITVGTGGGAGGQAKVHFELLDAMWNRRGGEKRIEKKKNSVKTI